MSDQAPAPLRWAVWLLAAESAGVLAVTVFLLYEDLTAPVGSAGGAFAVTLYAAVMATALGLLGWALHRRRKWARGPALVLQLLLIPIGYYMVTGGLAWLGVPVIAAGLAGAGMLVAPSTRAALGVH